MSKQKHNQQGIAHLALFALLAVIIAAVGFAAWRVTSTTNNKSATINSTTLTKTKVAPALVGGNCGTEKLDEADFNSSVSANINSNSTSSSSSTSSLTIANKCFNTAFKACRAASLAAVANFTVDGNKADERTDYVITGPKTGGCEVKQTYTKSSILPANLQGTDMICTLDNKLIFTAALSKSTNDAWKGCTGSFIVKSGL